MAIAAVPLPVAGLITGLITLGGVYGGGWLAKHTPRPEEYVAKRALVESPVGDEEQMVEEPVTDTGASDVDPDELLVPEYSTV